MKLVFYLFLMLFSITCISVVTQIDVIRGIWSVLFCTSCFCLPYIHIFVNDFWKFKILHILRNSNKKNEILVKICFLDEGHFKLFACGPTVYVYGTLLHLYYEAHIHIIWSEGSKSLKSHFFFSFLEPRNVKLTANNIQRYFLFPRLPCISCAMKFSPICIKNLQTSTLGSELLKFSVPISMLKSLLL